ncbi:MAG: hypothetical protein KBT12_08015, partial [Bacteroidales bacterium]|nr:hypothetical protein [Candidatus Physcousia equi]
AILLTISAKRARLLTIGTQLLECKINLPVKINFVHILFGCKVNTFTGRLQYAIAAGYTFWTPGAFSENSYYLAIRLFLQFGNKFILIV